MRNPDNDWQVMDPLGRMISFNFCTYAKTQPGGCEKETFAYMKYKEKCATLTSNEPKAEADSFI